MTTLSTHVLDTGRGGPASGVSVQLFDAAGAVLWQGHTDADGRCAGLRELSLEAGRYRLCFAVAAYFRNSGVALPEPPFLDEVLLDFGLGASGHYHVPLLCSPWSYSTYRGS
jgi:5-hydroxyisourate hydrolase